MFSLNGVLGSALACELEGFLRIENRSDDAFLESILWLDEFLFDVFDDHFFEG